MRSVCRSFITFNLLACCMLTLVVQGKSIAKVIVANASNTGGNVIRVWIVGSPFNDALPPATVPPELQRRAESFGYTIEVEAFRANGFAGKFRRAQQEHNEPEVLAFGNYGLIEGIQTPTGWFEGVASDPRTAPSLVLVHESLSSLQPRVMLIRSAVNYEAARALSMLAPVCEHGSAPAFDSADLPTGLSQAQETAAVAARAYLGCDQSTLSVISDESRLGQKCFLADSDTQVESVQACSVSGNRNFAFVSLVSSFSAQARGPRSDPRILYKMDLGKQSIFAVLRNQAGVWKLLAITDDPLNTIVRRPLTTPALQGPLEHGPTSGFAPEPARLLTPDGVYPRPAKGERYGDFIWQPSQSPNVIGQVVEFMIGKDSSRGLTRLVFLPVGERRLSTGLLLSGGPSAWRVWSVSKNGDVAFSETRSYQH